MSADGERSTERKRRRFAALATVPAVGLILAGVLLADMGGVANVIGLVCLAYGIGLAVAGVFIYVGRNPLAGKGADSER